MAPTTAIFECLTIFKVFILTIPLHKGEIPTAEEQRKEKQNQLPMSHRENLRHRSSSVVTKILHSISMLMAGI